MNNKIYVPLSSICLSLAIFLCGSLLTSIYAHPNDDSLFVSTDFTPAGTFTNGVEGPAVDDEGNLYAVNYEKQGTIGKVTPAGEHSIFVELPAGSIGNGIRFNTAGDMFIADYAKHNILKVNMTTKEITVFAHDSRMNQPNDIAIADNDIIYASDPNWGQNKGNIWRIDTDGSVHLLESNLATTNGIEVAPGSEKLYVNEGGGNVWAYDLSPTGEISNKKLHYRNAGAVMDGMRCDSTGNLYIALYSHGSISVISPEGTLVRKVDLIGSTVSNIAFGGPDGRTCYVTMVDNQNIESFRTDTPGRSWIMKNGTTTIGGTINESQVPVHCRLEQNYPNPFNPSTKIRYSISQSGLVQIYLYDILGRRLKTLVDEFKTAGNHELTFNGRDLSTGIYHYRIFFGNYTDTKQVVLLK